MAASLCEMRGIHITAYHPGRTEIELKPSQFSQQGPTQAAVGIYRGLCVQGVPFGLKMSYYGRSPSSVLSGAA